MNLQKLVQEKEIQIKKVVDEINQLQQLLNNKNQEVLRLDGALRQLQELDKETKKNKEENNKQG